MGNLSQGFNFGPTIFTLHANELPDDVICIIAIYADDAILYSMRFGLLATGEALIPTCGES